MESASVETLDLGFKVKASPPPVSGLRSPVSSGLWSPPVSGLLSLRSPGSPVALQKGVSRVSSTVLQPLFNTTCAGNKHNCGCVPSGMSRHPELNIWPRGEETHRTVAFRHLLWRVEGRPHPPRNPAGGAPPSWRVMNVAEAGGSFSTSEVLPPPGWWHPVPLGAGDPCCSSFSLLVCGGCGALTLASRSNELLPEEAASPCLAPGPHPAGWWVVWVEGWACTCRPACHQGPFPRLPSSCLSVKWEQVSVLSRSVGDASSHVRLAPCLHHRHESHLPNHRRLGNGSQRTLSLISFNSY